MPTEAAPAHRLQALSVPLSKPPLSGSTGVTVTSSQFWPAVPEPDHSCKLIRRLVVFDTVQVTLSGCQAGVGITLAPCQLDSRQSLTDKTAALLLVVEALTQAAMR